MLKGNFTVTKKCDFFMDKKRNSWFYRIIYQINSYFNNLYVFCVYILLVYFKIYEYIRSGE